MDIDEAKEIFSKCNQYFVCNNPVYCLDGNFSSQQLIALGVILVNDPQWIEDNY